MKGIVMIVGAFVALILGATAIIDNDPIFGIFAVVVALGSMYLGTRGWK